MPPTTPPATPGIQFSRVYEIGKDVLTIAVVPMAVWVITLTTENALQTERIENLQEEVVALKVAQGQVEKLREELHGLAIQQARMEGKVDTANARLDQIKGLLGER